MLRNTLFKAFTISSIALTGMVTWAAESDQINKPNIVLIMADDLGYECIGANGGTSYHTPVIDELAATGIRYTNCFANPLCTPSRVQLMTGMYNVRNYARFGVLQPDQITFGNLAKQAGYATCIAGKWQLGGKRDAPQTFGFDEACLWHHAGGGKEHEVDTRYSQPVLAINGEPRVAASGDYGPQVCADFICDFITEHKDQPFLVYYPMILTHCPFTPTPDSKAWDPDSPGSGTYKGDPAHFADMVAYMDKLVGQIATTLDTLGIRENTLILFLGDNGTDQPIISSLSGMEVSGEKGRLTNAGTRVPLVVSWPRRIRQGSVTNELVDFSDFLPTICDATGASLPDDRTIDGISLIPTLTGDGVRHKPWVYFWYDNQSLARTAHYGLIDDRRNRGKQTTFIHYLGPYVEEVLTLGEEHVEAEAAHALLRGVIDTLDATRPAGLPVPKR